jgi:hypothetical protein
MNRRDVRSVLDTISGFRPVATLHGFEWPHWVGSSTTRLTHGGGIAGRSNVWWTERLYADGVRILSREVSTRRDLRSIVVEDLADARPPERDGYTLYARSVPSTASVCWFYRRKRAE